MKVRAVGLTGHAKNELAKGTAMLVGKFLKKQGKKFFFAKEFGLKAKHSVPLREFKADLVLVFGGDGALLHTFRALGGRQIPVLGINCGEVGFLMDLDSENCLQKMPLVVEGKFHVEKRVRLEGEADGARLPPALNEYVLSPARSATVLRYSLSIDGCFFWKDTSDGVIVSTQTGSTAYSLSAGGPVVEKNAPVSLIVPINSMAGAKSLVASENSRISIGSISSAAPCEIVVDGQERIKVKETIEIRKSKFPALLARMKVKDAEKTAAKNVPKQASPSTKFIFRVLQEKKGLTQKEIVAETQLPARTAARALDYLLKKQLVLKKSFPVDSRKDLFVVKR